MIGDNKPLPNHVELEQAVLSAALQDQEYRETALSNLDGADLYANGHRVIFEAIRGLCGDGVTVSLPMLATALKASGLLDAAGGGGYVAGLADIPMPPSDQGVRDYCRKIREAADLRRLLGVCNQISKDALNANGDAPEVIARAKSDLEKIGAGSGGRSLKNAVFEAGAFLKIDAPARVHHLFPWFWSGSYGLISGARGVGKTFFVMGALDAITRGAPFGPWECHEPAPCLYLEGELPIDDCKGRIRDVGLSGKRVAPLHILSDAYVCEVMKRPGGVNLGDATMRAELRALFLDLGVKVVVFDNLASLTPGIDENSKQEWDQINRWMLGLRYAGISPWLIHHLGKSGDQRGTSGREDNIDVSIKLQRPTNYQNEDGARFVVNFSKRRISHHALRFVNDIELQFRPDEGGAYCWTFGDVQQNNRRRVVELLDEGVCQADIAKELGITKSAVCQQRKKAIQEGLLTDKGKLTQGGFAFVHGASETA